MPKFTTKQVKDLGREVLERHKTGIRWTELIKEVKKITSKSPPPTPPGTITGSLRALVKDEKEGIDKISRGVYILKQHEKEPTTVEAGPPQETTISTPKGETTIKEEVFYGPFVEWLKSELGEANEAEVLGGNILGGRWGTPDVLGVLKPLAADPVKFPPEIVSVEIKLDPNQPIIAFGQAIAYRLFSHKVYIVMPNTIAPADLDRLEALSVIHGLGLITFSLNPQEPNF